MPDCAKHCSIASQTGRTSWKPGPNPIDSAGHSIVRRKEQRQQRSKAVEMTSCGKHGKPKAGFPPFPQAFDLSPDEIKGRNTWVMWTAGNDRLWDKLTLASAGVLDFIKTLSSYPGLKASRDNRWTYLGLVNEPCFVKATGPDPKRYGLWLDQR